MKKLLSVLWYIITGTFIFMGVLVIIFTGLACLFAPFYAWAVWPNHPCIATAIGFTLYIAANVIQGCDL